ncbi:MAG: hypothetical protein EOM24_22180, partial [Chloroflexia bacterium]|nr:hypothetical protein [Chloroflexia bacterium]
MTRTHAFDAVYRLASHAYGSQHFGTAFGCYPGADGLSLLQGMSADGVSRTAWFRAGKPARN